MNDTSNELVARIARLEGTLRRQRRIGGAMLVGFLALVVSGMRQEEKRDLRVGSLTADHVVVVDHAGRKRIELGEDPADTQRRSRSCGFTLFDETGAERGGMSTFADLSVVLGMDSPAGVGASMRDRIGLVVNPDGSARVDLINNETMIPVRLTSGADGSGGVEFFEYDLEKSECTITRLNHEGRTERVVSLGG